MQTHRVVRNRLGLVILALTTPLLLASCMVGRAQDPATMLYGSWSGTLHLPAQRANPDDRPFEMTITGPHTMTLAIAGTSCVMHQCVVGPDQVEMHATWSNRAYVFVGLTRPATSWILEGTATSPDRPEVVLHWDAEMRSGQ